MELIDSFAQPVFKFSGPLALVGELVAESPAVSASRISVERSWHFVGEKCCVVVDAVGRGDGAVIGREHYEGLRCVGSDLKFVGIFLDEFIRWVFTEKVYSGAHMGLLSVHADYGIEEYLEVGSRLGRGVMGGKG